MNRFYIIGRSNWTGDRWKAIAGPYLTRAEAEDIIRQAPEDGSGPWGNGGDVRSRLHTRVVTRTELASYGYPSTAEGEYYLLAALHSAALGQEGGGDE